MKTFKVATTTSLVALSIATNYLLIGFYNIKLTDFITFFGGFWLGYMAGASIGILSWLIYGVINPFGFVPQVWLATMFTQSIYGIVGGFLGRRIALTDFHGQRIKLSIFFATVGFLPTVCYDLITNLVYASSFNVPFGVAILTGAPFTVLHELANAAIFGICTIPVITASVRFIEGAKDELS